ncbi:MAG: hypothetical protein M3494_01500 [Actinomycetota bacterium]|jgi:hypothetical protein|nr:hypothetical protein [Actinomycetota bacterium]
MRKITLWLGLTVVGAALQLYAITSDFYIFEGEVRDAWFGIPHASDLLVLSALVAVALFVLTAIGRNPISGRGIGLFVGIVGSLATLQLGYRMIVPPFDGLVPSNSDIIGGGCLFYCLPSQAVDAQLLPGIWIGFIGCLLVAVGGFLHAFSPAARNTQARSWIARSQTGMTPWLGLAALGAIGQFVFGYTFFTFYITPADTGGETYWSGWLPSPHTSSIVLGLTVAVAALAWYASRGKSPLNPMAFGGLIAFLGLLSTYRIFFRIIEPPFGDGADIGFAAYLSLLSAILIIVAGLVHAVTQRATARASAPNVT